MNDPGLTRGLQRGMTLVELLVALAIGIGVTLAVASLLVVGENHKRTTTSTNDADQTGAYTFNVLDKLVRGAGSGFAQSASSATTNVLGCTLNVSASGVPILGYHAPATFPSPFTNFSVAPSSVPVAPLLIGQGQSLDGVSDVLMVMSGSGSAGGVSRQITGTSGSSVAVLDNTIGFSTTLGSSTADAVNLVLVSQSTYQDCLLEQVSSITPTNLPTNLNFNSSQAYYTSSSATTSLSNLVSSTSSYVTPLGNVGTSMNPIVDNVQFKLIGVDNTHTLYSYDLLRTQSLVCSPCPTDAAQPISDGVYQFNAIYGIDTNGDGTQDVWAAPGSPDTNYSIANVMASPSTMQKIVSVRVSLLVRGEYYDKNAVSPTSFTMFSGLVNAGGTSLAKIVNIGTTDQHYRYRLIEFTIPLRNMILLAGGP